MDNKVELKDNVIVIDNITVEFSVSTNNVQILNSYKVPKKYFKRILNEIKSRYSDNNVFKNRKIQSMMFEWATHNFCYKINYQRQRTKDVDLNYPQNKMTNIAYNVIGCLVWLFV